jgi:DNA-binding GntR family transcriptional regulator
MPFVLATRNDDVLTSPDGHVSLGTANRAVALLRGEGLVSTRRGQRTVVTVQPESRT